MSIYNKIINELSQSLGINVRHPQISDDYYNFDASMQIAICCYYQNPVYYNTFKEIVHKYNFNGSEYLDYAIKLISKEKQNAENFIRGLFDKRFKKSQKYQFIS